MTVTEYIGKKLYTIEGVLSTEKCVDIITNCNDKGWKASAPSGSGHGNIVKEQPRTSQLSEFSDTNLLDALWTQVIKYLPKDLSYINWDANFGHKGGSEWKPLCMYPIFRVYRYQPGDKFPEHHDYRVARRYETEDEIVMEMSFTSYLVYLNDDFENGETGYWPDESGIHCRFNSNIAKQSSKMKAHQIKIIPKTGMGVVQYQHILHEGIAPTKENKYILRADIIYQKRTSKHARLQGTATEVPTTWDRIFEPGCKNYAD
jgi:hypothetical protein